MSTPSPLLLRGGRVIDPAQGIDGPNDVLVRDGRIAAVGPGLAADGAEVLDCTGLLVLPGLIDVHVHCFKGLGTNAVDPDLQGVQRGVTTIVDAGGAGHTAFPLFRDYVMPAARTRVLAFLNLSSPGAALNTRFPRLGDPRLIEPDAIAATVEASRDRIVGIKMHAITSALGALGLEPIRRGCQIAAELGIPAMIHIGESWGDGPEQPIEQVMALFQPRDIVTHMYTGQRGGVLDPNGRLVPAVQDARDRGVRFDIGHGAQNLSFAVAQRLLDHGFPPDTISTDCSHMSLLGPVYDLPTTMAKFLGLGLPLRDVVATVTSQAAAQIGRADDLGSLAVGREADVSVLRLEEREWTAVDSMRQQMPVREHLTPVLTVRAGEVIRPRPGDGP
jgi:dihydroorotase